MQNSRPTATINTQNIEGRSITAAENNRALWLIALRVFTHRGGHETTDIVILRYDQPLPDRGAHFWVMVMGLHRRPSGSFHDTTTLECELQAMFLRVGSLTICSSLLANCGCEVQYRRRKIVAPEYGTMAHERCDEERRSDHACNGSVTSARTTGAAHATPHSRPSCWLRRSPQLECAAPVATTRSPYRHTPCLP